MADHPETESQESPEAMPVPPPLDPDPELIGWFERSYPAPREDTETREQRD